MTNDVLLSIDLDIETKKSDHLKLDFWMNPTSLDSYTFILDFKKVIEEF